MLGNSLRKKRRQRCMLFLEQGSYCNWRGLNKRLYFCFGGENTWFITVFLVGVGEYSGVYLYFIKGG